MTMCWLIMLVSQMIKDKQAGNSERKYGVFFSRD
jgi:hypothetical protein